MRSSLIALVFLLLAAGPAPAAKRALFDNAHAETAGNADWIIDDTQPVPSPAQAGIGPATPRTYWLGGLSSWGVDLVKRGYTVATNTGTITYGTAGTYDLSNWDVFIVPEPNTLFSASEVTAILNFVHDGGGLVAVGDHWQSDRNNDGQDSPMIWNAFDPGFLLGVHWGVSGDANNNVTQVWSTNINASPSDLVTHGPEGTVTGLEFHNGTTFTLHPEVNPTVRGEVWMNGGGQGLVNVMAASCTYGAGRVVMAGDSSPIDDGSATPGNTSIFDGWGEAAGSDSVFFLNATLWVTRDSQAPSVSLTSPAGGELWMVGDPHDITWSASDDIAVGSIDLDLSTSGPGGPFDEIAHGLPNTGTYSWNVTGPGSQNAVVRVTAADPTGNNANAAGGVFTIGDVNAVPGGPAAGLSLSAPQPNPGTESTELRFSLPQTGRVRIDIVDTAGRRVWSHAADGRAGPQSWTWSGIGTDGTRAGAGLYLVRLSTPWGERTRSLVWLR